MDAHVPSLLYIFMSGMDMSSRIEGRGLLFISVIRAVEGLNVDISTVPTPLFMKNHPVRELPDNLILYYYEQNENV